MLRLGQLVLLVLFMVVLVASMEDPLEPARVEPEPGQKNAQDLDAEASEWIYSRPYRYGWKGGWNGWNGGWNGGWNKGWGGSIWAGRGWAGRGWW